jgi:hypothetical protein
MFSCSFTASVLNNAEDVVRLYHQVIVPLHLDFGSRVLAVHYQLSDVNLDVLVRAHGDDLGVLVLPLGRVRQHDPRGGASSCSTGLSNTRGPSGLNLTLRPPSYSLVDAHKVEPSLAIRQRDARFTSS